MSKKIVRKIDIVERLAEEKGYTKSAARQVISDLTEMITKFLAEGQDVTLRGFGTFYVKDIAPRESVTPRTFERIVIPGHKSVRFQVGNTLRDAVRIPEED